MLLKNKVSTFLIPAELEHVQHVLELSLIHISEPTRRYAISYAVFCLKNNGKVIFSGILNSQKDEIIKILIQNDLKLLDVSTRKDWACISAQKTSDPT